VEFLPDRRPQILFERHIFGERTNRRFEASRRGISAPKPGSSSKHGSYQRDRLEKAITIHRQGALDFSLYGLYSAPEYSICPFIWMDELDEQFCRRLT
jgi:N-acetylmuramidase